MRLRADIGEVDVVLADWWQEFSQASDAVREDLVAQLRVEQTKGQRRVRVPRPAGVQPAVGMEGPSPAVQSAHEHGPRREAGDEGDTEGDAATGDAPRKRRRRRRKPTGEGAPRPAGESQD
jgi:poly(A) polymerase